MAKLATMALSAIFLATAALAEIAGSYLGLAEAKGLRLDLQEAGGRYTASFTDLRGVVTEFRAEKLGEMLEGEMSLDGERMLVRVRPRPIGAELVLLPMDAEGLPVPSGARAFAFLRQGVDVPDQPENYIAPPAGPIRAIDGGAFVSSYAFWNPMEVAWAYDAVEPRLRTVIRLFPLVQTDVAWKICAAPRRTAGIAEALRGQGVGCSDILSAMERAQASNAFSRFKRDVEVEKRELVTAMDCADDLTRTRRDCSNAANAASRRAVSMETIQTVLARYR